jgi:hypothetical protein
MAAQQETAKAGYRVLISGPRAGKLARMRLDQGPFAASSGIFAMAVMPISAAAKKTSMMALAAIPLALALVGCSAERATTASLAGACQFKPCVCASTKALFWQAAETVPVLWKENGDAYCPPDYALLRASEKKSNN